MEFGSKYVYTYSDSEEEEVYEDEYECAYTDCIPVGFTARSGDPGTSDTAPAAASEDAESNRESSAVLSGAATKSPRSIGALFKSTKSSKKPVSQPPQKVHHWMKLPSSKSVSKSQELVADAGNVGSGSSARPLRPRGPAAKKWRRADTNVVSIKFDRLTTPSHMHTGDPVVCTGCQAMLSHISKLTKEAENDLWICEFCGVSNAVDLVSEEMPTQPDVTYMVEPAPVTTATGRSGIDESLVVFCVDVSGSMCVSQEVPGTMRLKGNHSERFSSLNTENEDQWLRGQRRDVTYVTRLQGLQAAVDNQLQELARDHPNRRIALVTFNSEVTVVGDGSGIPLTVAGDKLSNGEELMKVGSEVSLPASIATSHVMLGKKIFELEEGGQTALGPALLVSVMIACQVTGSKVIICTDGMANVGLGSLDNLCTTEGFEEASTFYHKVSEVANGKGVSVSVLTIAGTECKLVELGRVASQTGGQVNTVDPMKLTQEFGNILADPIIATRVVAAFTVHKGLYIRHEADGASRAVKEVGNVTKGTEITFEYGVRRLGLKQGAAKEGVDETADKDAEAVGGNGGTTDQGKPPRCPPRVPGPPPPVSESEELPFQVQISYVDLEGARAVRVLTQTKPLTKEREQAEKYMNMPILSAHALQQSSALAIEGDYMPSRLNAYMYQRLFYRNVDDTSRLHQYRAYSSRTAPLTDGLLQEQVREARSSGQTVMQLDEYDNEEDEEERAAMDDGAKQKQSSRGLVKGPSKAKAQRRMNCPDVLAQNAYMNRAASSRAVEDDASPQPQQ